MPKISVITICKNEKSGIEKTLSSVVSQTFKDYEYIVIDGASTDGTQDIIEMYRSKLTHYCSAADGGIYQAQNKGIDLAKGEYLLFLNGGDYLIDEKVLEHIFSASRTADIIYGNLKIIDKGTVREGFSPSTVDLYHLLKGTLWHPASFIKRSLFEKYGKYKVEFRIVADYEFFLRVICIHRVSTQYVPRFITMFNTDGVGSSELFREQHDKERRLAQLANFPESVLDAMHSYRMLNESSVANRMKFLALGFFEAIKRRL